MSAVGMCKSVDINTDSQNLLRARCEVNGYGRDCRILDLKSHGAFLESFVPAVTGTRVTLRFDLPNGHQVCTGGIVRYHQFKVGFGIDFVDMPPSDAEQIVSLVG
ncbi:MAG: PilZ domain-containing protein [Blastocatellia bacterium]|nr:PilZ domain-containing protein [Blastocatellia bacterium]